MNSKKNLIRALAAACVLLVVYHVLAFLIPFEHGGPFWAGYVFGLIAILGAGAILFLAFRGTASARSKFYGMPIARVGVLYLAAQMVVSFAAMALSFVSGCPAWPFILISALLLGAAALGVIAADVTREEITRQDVVLKANVKTMRSLQSLGRSLVGQCEDKTLAANLQKLSNDLQYSDPVTSDATVETEAELGSLLDELQRALLENDAAGAAGLCSKARSVLAERNRICKLNKG